MPDPTPHRQPETDAATPRRSPAAVRTGVPAFRRWGPTALLMGWFLLAGGALHAMMAHGTLAGEAARAAPVRPSEPGERRPSLTMFVHPECPCSQASVDVLAELLARYRGRADVTIVFADVAPSGEIGPLWKRAGRIAGVRLVRDAGDAMSLRYDARTSGQTFL